MKIISLLQPWATLVVIGAKKIETRSWNTTYRGPLLIHSSARMKKEHKALCNTEPFKSALAGIPELPLGAIIGMAAITGTSDTSFYMDAKKAGIKLTDDGGNWDDELAFGDYSPGRYGWLLSKPVSFRNHIQWKGELGIRDFEHLICQKCGCMDHDCRACIEKTGRPCSWVSETLCSACLKR
jgi:hypothetical protein